MNKTEIEPIFSSTGRLGVSRRQYGRLYANGCYCADPAEVGQTFQRLTAIRERYQQKISRSVLRGLVSEGVMQHISHRVRSVVEQGYSFVDLIQADQLDQMHTLWSDTFGWNHQELDGLRKKLEANKYKDPAQRDIWFAAIRHNGAIISAAMAERLGLPTACGQLDLVESTEWRTKDGYTGNGLMTATLAMLNAKILSDFQDNPNGLPLIYAECNFQSRSDRAGYGVGFRVPRRIHSSQILVQNVLVRDGQPVAEGRLRDFTFMYLPAEAIRNHYSPSQTQEMRQLIK